MPSNHIFALTCNILCPLSVGGTLVIVNNILPSKIFYLIDEYKIKFIIAVPTFIKVLLYSLKKKTYNVSSLKKGIIGGDRFSESLFHEWQKLTGVSLLQGYGLTETCPVICNQLDNIKPDSIGKPMLNTRIKIADENGKELANYKNGMIWIKSDSMFDGYLKFDELNKILIVDGWFNSGDIGYKDDDDFYFFVKREQKYSKNRGSYG